MSGAFVISPLPPMLLEPSQTAGSLCSTDITLFLRYYGPIRHPLAVPRFPGFAGYTGHCSADFATGQGGLLQLLGISFSSCCRYYPARVSRRMVRLRLSMLPSLHDRELGLWGHDFEATSAFTFVTAR